LTVAAHTIEATIIGDRPVHVLGVSTSPRRNGNSDQLLRRALDGASTANVTTEYIWLGDLTIGPCNECGACDATGICVVKDDYDQLLAKILGADRLVFATPIFFAGPCAQAKILIDRAQCQWVHKHVLKKPPAAPSCDRRALVIAVAGSRGTKQFGCLKMTMKHYFDALDIAYAFNLFVNRIDAKDDIRNHPAAMTEAFRLGRELVCAEAPTPKEPLDTELF